MTTDSHHFEIVVGGTTVVATRKPIKRLRLAVHPPDGLVRASVPMGMSADVVRAAVAGRLGWVRRAQRAYEQQPRQTPRQWVTGESHYVDGRRLRLAVVEDVQPIGVRVRNGHTLELSVRSDTNAADRARMVAEWYRARLKEHVGALIAKWEPHIGVPLTWWGVRRMKTRWGSCNPVRRRVLLNLELAKKSPQCVEYVLVHELVHLLIADHGSAFEKRLGELLPDWRTRRTALQRTLLADECWMAATDQVMRER